MLLLKYIQPNTLKISLYEMGENTSGNIQRLLVESEITNWLSKLNDNSLIEDILG